MAFSERAMDAKAKSSMVSSKSSMVRSGCEKSFVPIVGDFCPFIAGTNMPS